MVTPPIKDCFFSLDIKIPLFRKECGAAAPPRPGSSIRGRWGIHTCFLSAALRAAPLLSSPKRGSYRPCGAGLFCRLAGGGAFFSLVGKEAKAPSRDVPSLENPSHYGGYCFLRFHWSPSGLKQAAPMDRAKRLFEDVNADPTVLHAGSPGAVPLEGPPSRLYPFNRPAGGVG